MVSSFLCPCGSYVGTGEGIEGRGRLLDKNERCDANGYQEEENDDE